MRPGPSETEEAEANLFAIELLMPEHWIHSDMGDYKTPLDIEDDSVVRAMAKRYEVSRQLMTLRLQSLGYFR